jgi:fatty acid desaturase
MIFAQPFLVLRQASSSAWVYSKSLLDLGVIAKEASQKMAGYYYERAGALNRELKRAIPRETLKDLHEKQAWRHLLIAARQCALFIGLPILMYFYRDVPWVWIPAAVLQGFVIFGFTVLLHEVVHKVVFKKERKRTMRLLSLLYSTFSGLAASQFHKWHMDHHFELGCSEKDPKRAHLSPKRNARWYKALYMTPALFPIYFRAAAKAQADYPEDVRKRIKAERLVSIGFHLAVLGFFTWIDPWFALIAHVIPVFFVFPVAFTINRLGQHYIIDTDDIAKWSTLMRPNPVWNFLFLYSSYHLEHHYFPAVPFYKLKPLQKALDAFYEERGVKTYTYRQLLKAWFWDNHVPHTRLLEDG